jgi:murein DD-endopeptidase MepM/ murein hydrolase activator NlpD
VGRKIAVAVSVLAVGFSLPGGAALAVLPQSSSSTSTTTSTSTSTSTSVPAQTRPDTIPVDPNNLAQQVSEAPPAEAQLIGLLDTVRARLASLTVQLQTLDNDLANNQAALDKANQALALSQAAVTVADQRVAALTTAVVAARTEIRQRAVAAYISQPAGQLANLVLHLHDPADLTDIKAFYQVMVDAQVKTVERYDRLQRDARKAAKAAAAARDLARRQQLAVAGQQATLTALRSTFHLVQQESLDQQNQQTALLGQASADKAAFEAAVQQQQQLSNQIEALLQNLEQASTASGGAPLPASNGFFQVPVPGAPITSPFGPRVDPILGIVGFHPGLDFGATFGTPIEAAGDGVVVWAGPDGGYGNCTIIDHGHSMATLYAHQSMLIVHVGDQVTRGQVIGEVGSTGYSTGPHLHFEVRISGVPVNPLPYL